jgi:hypothetical protein
MAHTAVKINQYSVHLAPAISVRLLTVTETEEAIS